MERIIWTHQSDQPFYIFEGEHIVHFWDDGLSIHRTSSWYRDADTRLSPFDGPHVYPKALALDFYKRTVLNSGLPISIVLEGDNLGTITRTSGYVQGDAEPGAYRRRITKQRTTLHASDDNLVLGLHVDATPVDPETVLGHLNEEDTSRVTLGFEFPFPFDAVPEIFDFTESESRVFHRNWQRSPQ